MRLVATKYYLPNEIKILYNLQSLNCDFNKSPFCRDHFDHGRQSVRHLYILMFKLNLKSVEYDPNEMY